ADQLELFEPRLEPSTIPIHLDRIRLERSRSFAQVYLGWPLWRGLGLDRLFEDLLPKGREKVSWSTMAAILVIARLCEPSSELYIADLWYASTALDDILGAPEERVNDDRLYRALDRRLPHKEAIETHLKEKMGELFDGDYDLLLYGVTSTYFEVEPWCNRAGLGRSLRLILQEMAELHSADIVLPTAEASSRDLRIRCVVRPDKAQAHLLDRLGLRLPQRLMIPAC
ncbi:MAG: hypothetical protein MI919_32920, partial [Holophagales bacterium]|nr:hypothetical protein [Holophagales bacterium]